MSKPEFTTAEQYELREYKVKSVRFLHSRTLIDEVVDFLWEMDGKEYPGEASKEHAVVYRMGEPKRKLNI
jgi:hypothetical protein